MNFVAPIRNDKVANAFDGGVPNVIEDDYAARLQHLVDVEEVDQGVVKGMPSIDECELDFLALAYEGWQNLLGLQFVKFVQSFITCSTDIVETTALPVVI